MAFPVSHTYGLDTFNPSCLVDGNFQNELSDWKSNAKQMHYIVWWDRPYIWEHLEWNFRCMWLVTCYVIKCNNVNLNWIDSVAYEVCAVFWIWISNIVHRSILEILIAYEMQHCPNTVFLVVCEIINDWSTYLESLWWVRNNYSRYVDWGLAANDL